MLFPLTVELASVNLLADTPPPKAKYPAVLFPLTVEPVSVTLPPANNAPPLARAPAVLLPVIELLSNVSSPLLIDRIAPPLWVSSAKSLSPVVSAARQRETVELKVAGRGGDVENARQFVGVDRHVIGQRGGVDRERLGNL